MEVWKDIKGYEGYYQVSSLGYVKSLSKTIIRKDGKPLNVKGGLLKQNLQRSGYQYVKLCSHDGQISYSVHRLVAKAFKSNPENKPQVNHINGIKTDNRAKNLEWCTAKENVQHSIAMGLHNNYGGENSPFAKLTENQVIEIRNKYIPHRYTAKKLANEYNISEGGIRAIIYRESWKNI